MFIIYAVDIGSVKSGNFAWARLANHNNQINSDTSIENLVKSIIKDIAQEKYICLGIECPLFINLPSNPVLLTSARVGEGSRPWSAGAGCGSLATGLSETLWLFSELKLISSNSIVTTFELDDLIKGSANLFIWEAFVTSKSKGNTHCEDSIIAVKKFAEKLQTGLVETDVSVENPFSLVGASLLRSGITSNIDVLKKQCIVVKA